MTTKLFNQIIAELEASGKKRTAETYRATLNALLKFTKGNDIPLKKINPLLTKQFEQWLANRGVCPNTSSFYLRILRAAYNRAVKRGLTKDRKPFSEVYTGVAHTIKRALPLKTISQLSRLDLSNEPKLDLARDIFMLSFMLRGMSFIDLCLLKKSQLKGEIITYRRQKTGRILCIRLTPQIHKILNKYPQNPTDRLLPILCHHVKNIRAAYRNKCAEINANLKLLMPRLGLHEPLTLYVARHSWASAAQEKGININTISEAMGHDSILTTQIYLASISNEAIHNANAIILSAI